LAKGKTVIKNASLEPEVEHLANFLSSSGAKIEGAGTKTITIAGGKLLSARRKTYVTLPDRIETGSFLILGALAARNLNITNCNPLHVESLIETFRTAGVSIKTKKNSISITRNTKPNKSFRSIDIKTQEYPGFPTDLQAPMTVFLTQTTGEALVFETIFEGRLNNDDP